MNNNVVEKTLKSIDNIDRLSDLAAISIYNTSHEAIDKFDVMQEHATPEYVEGEFVQESLLTGVLIGAGIIGVAISAFLIIKKIIESKAKGDPNAAPNTVAGVNLLNPDEINKLFDGWNDKYFKNHPDLVAEDVPGADVSELNTYNGLLLESIRKFCDDATTLIDGLNELSDADMKAAIDDLNKEFDSNINMNELVSKTGRVDKNTILQIKAAAEDISKTLREFDMQVTKCIEGFRNKEKNNQNSDSDTEENKISEENIKLLEKALKAKANTAGTIMVNFRNKCLEGIAQALDAKVKEAEGQAKAKQQQEQQKQDSEKELKPLTDVDKQTIIDICVKSIKMGYEESDEDISNFVKEHHTASPEEIQEIINEVRAKTNGSSKEPAGGPESGPNSLQDNESINSETDESSTETKTPEGTPESATDKVPETQTGTGANGDNQTKDDNAEKLAKLDAMRNDQNAVNELKGQMTAIDGERPEQTLEIAFNHAYDSIRSYMDGTDTYDYIVSDEISQYQDDNTLTKSVIKKLADARFDNCNKVFNKLGLDLLSKPADGDIDTIINDAFTTYNITDSSTEIPAKTNETSNTKLFTDEEVDKIVDAVYAVKGLDRKFRQEIYNAVTDDGFVEAANKLYAKYADDANKLDQIHTTLIAMAKSISKESEVPALPTTETTPPESETSTENQTPEYSDKGITYDGNTIIINGKPITEKEWPDDYNETANKIISGLMKNGTGAGNAVSYVNDLWKTHCNGDMIKYLNRMYGRYKDLPEEQERFYTRVKEMAKVLGEPPVDQLPEPSAEYETTFVDGKPIPVDIKNNASVETPEGTPEAETPSDTAPGVVTDNEELKKIADDLGLPLGNFISAYDKVKEGNADYTESQMLTTVFNNQIAFNQFTLPAINEAIAKEYDKCKQVADAVHAPFDVEPITIDEATFEKLHAYFDQKNKSVSNMETAKLIPGALADMVMDEMRSSETISPEAYENTETGNKTISVDDPAYMEKFNEAFSKAPDDRKQGIIQSIKSVHGDLDTYLKRFYHGIDKLNDTPERKAKFKNGRYNSIKTLAGLVGYTKDLTAPDSPRSGS